MATHDDAPVTDPESAIMEILEAEESAEVEAGENEPAEEVTETDAEEETVEEEVAEIDSEDQEPEAEEESEPLYTVKVNGEEIEVPLAELRNGYSRLEDYKAKTAQVAEERRAVDAEKQAYVEKLNTVIQTAQLIDPVLSQGNQTDWASLAREDPAEYTARRAEYEQRLNDLNRLASERDQHIQQQQADTMKREEEALIAARPEWADPAVGQAAMQGIRESLVNNYGFAPEEVQMIANHKFALIADDARKYHELVAKQETVKAKKAPPKPTKSLKSGNNSKASSFAAAKKKAKSGSLDDQVAFIASQL